MFSKELTEPEQIWYKKFLKEAIENRSKYLEAKKREYVAETSDRKKKKVIAELIQLEPSHLAEDWIMDHIIKALKNHNDNIDFLDDAFIAKGKRDEITEEQCGRLAHACFLEAEVKKRALKTGSKSSAIREIVQGLENPRADQPETALKQRLTRFRKAMNKRDLPFPYYGKDVVEFDRGTENHRIEIQFGYKPLDTAYGTLFGDWVFEIPLSKIKK